MRKIAEEVGIKPASIYFFYENKEELFIAAFQKYLDDHFKMLERTLHENKEKHVRHIFSAMLHEIVAHHRGDLTGTNVYVSLVTTPISGIEQHLNKHMLQINVWLVESLESALKWNYPRITASEVDQVIKQWVIIGNGIFWGIMLYEGDALLEQVELADQMINTLFLEIEKNI